MDKKITSLILDLQTGRRLALAQVITLLESERLEDQKFVDEFMKVLSQQKIPNTLRIGLTGAPGAGKSSLIEKIGLQFIQQGFKVAVLAIDPSSDLTQGSVLGDKTRMEELSAHENAFIRPSPSRGHLGGVSVATHDAIQVCELAGYEIIIVETVGVGQSESQVSDLVDLFALVALPGAGDELQGIKRGVLEKIDCVLINKFDGENKISAQIAEKQLQSSLQILRKKTIPTFLTSAIYSQGISEFCAHAISFWKKSEVDIREQRQQQETRWVSYYVRQFVDLEIKNKIEGSEKELELKKDILQKKILPRQAARELLKKLKDPR